jgi:signal transduction histidine kinase
LGLSVVKAVVEAHGGGATVTTTPGQGSEFTVTLPAARTETVAAYLK